MASIHLRIENKDTIEEVVDIASKIAVATRRTIQFTFNDFPVLVGPNHTPDAVIKDYIKRATTFKGDED